MSEQVPDQIVVGSTELPDVLYTLAGMLPKFDGVGLEGQLQNFDNFLEYLSPSTRPKIADLLRTAATQAPTPEVRTRLEAAAESVGHGGRAAEPYDHTKALKAYQASFQKEYPDFVESTSGDLKQESHSEILAQLDLIEAELKRVGFWSENPPDLIAAIHRGDIKSYLDAPSFELWLQCIFLPQARERAKRNDLPGSSQVAEMARRQYDYMSVVPEAGPLLHLLQKFDQLIIAANQC